MYYNCVDNIQLRDGSGSSICPVSGLGTGGERFVVFLHINCEKNDDHKKSDLLPLFLNPKGNSHLGDVRNPIGGTICQLA
jgi:hypothetical protein